MNVLFITSECVPFAKTGGLADVAGSLPKALSGIGVDARVFMPRYGGVTLDESTPKLCDFTIRLGKKKMFGSIHEGRAPNGTIVYFLDQPYYFDRPELYVENGRDYPDNAERFIFFVRAAVEFIRKKSFVPDVAHINDWFTGLFPVVTNTVFGKDALISPIATVITLHNMAYQGIFDRHFMDVAGLHPSLFRMDTFEYYGKMNFLKAGLVFSEKISAVSPRYAEEIQTPEFGHGLEGVLEHRKADIAGIINGVDYDIWNPETDSHIARTYGRENLGGKAECKSELQRLNNLPFSDAPLLGMVSRIVEQKGFDLLVACFERIMDTGSQFVLLGSGEPALQEKLMSFARRYPLQVGINLAFSEELARKIEAGCDIYLMPSRFEPCGLNQLYSLKYGSVPVVRAVGGLADTVREWDFGSKEGTGFVFEEYNPGAFMAAVERAQAVFAKKKDWEKLVRNGMSEDWSWARSAAEYRSLYEAAIEKRGARVR